MFYRLDGKTPVPCSANELEALFQPDDTGDRTNKRRVALTFNHDKTIQISTVFLGLDHSYDDVPQLFETIVFENGEDIFMTRYSTWEEAEEGHGECVARFT